MAQIPFLVAAFPAVAAASSAAEARGPPSDPVLTDTFKFWDGFRNPANGLWCDTVAFQGPQCGAGNTRYSSASTGMGLMSDAVAAEIGLMSSAEARRRALQTLGSLQTIWPREAHHGFFVHWLCGAKPCGEYSTIDTAEMSMGALFAGNYFGSEVLRNATAVAKLTDWSVAIKAADSPTIYPVVDGATGALSGNIMPYNEYYIVAYIAKLMDPSSSSKASQYFETYFATSGVPKGDGGHPVHLNYWGYDLLTDNTQRFMSSFIPQFCWLQTRGFHTNTYYASTLFPAWMEADIKYWDLALSNASQVWGHKIKGRVWGAGAGQAPTGYSVERIDGSADLVASPAIMAGFLGAATPPQRDSIKAQLRWLYDNKVCAYDAAVAGGEAATVLWRCSAAKPEWRAVQADSIDFSTLPLGYATLYLPDGFYAAHAA